ncbi:hypothetical protein QET93_002405 [Akkermansia sp. N21116]|uniref:hypothetical protein n=1 Tax=Akkermansia sp. N21116 TaxID=3040764 RepID=UPI00244E6BFB|nr:hypothetical protein [Akkermansia sp. N21116]WPX40956.1 hypothetical protein QET93_002405 [Akkermansia sp. N21116]
MTEQFGSGTQPIRKDYDSNGRMIALTTWRNPGETLTGIPDTPGDITQWEYDSLSGLPVKKTYADGTSETTVYNRDRLVIRTVRADGSSIGYIDQAETWELAETSFSDQSTPICHSYDALGRLASITDGTGTRTYSYNHVGDLMREEFEGSVRSILEYKFDACGRDAGYTLSVDGVNVQDTALTYDSFGRLQTASPEEGKVFTWHYGEGELLTGMDWPNGTPVRGSQECHFGPCVQGCLGTGSSRPPVRLRCARKADPADGSCRRAGGTKNRPELQSPK